MNKVIKILHLEDSLSDSELIHSYVECDGLVHEYFLADNEKDYLNILETENIDIILSDYSLPDYSGSEALKVAREKYSHIPFLFVSGAMGEDAAINAMLNGATDYVLKHKLERLVPAIKRALLECENENKRRLAVEELKESGYYLKKIIDSVASPIFVKDENHKFCLVNHAVCKLLHHSEEELIDKTGFELFPKEEYDFFIAKDQEVFDTGKENINEESLTNGDGKIKTLITRKTLYTDLTGKKYLVGVVNDISERKQDELLLKEKNKELNQLNNDLIKAKDHAEESDRLKSSFLANMSHEIRTPMNGILGFAELLKELKLSGEEQQEYIGIIEKSGARMLNIINDIMSISKVESGQMDVRLSETDINEKIEYIYTFFKPEADKKGLKLSYKTTLTANEAVINTDKEKIYAIMTNLVKNALKFTREGAIEFGYEKKGRYLEFFVRDTGIGILPEKRGIIFERFRQVSESYNRDFEGAGLGLPISKAYVELLGGKIRVESKYGKGSVFYFTLPYLFEAEEKIVIQKIVPEIQEKIKINNLKILIVEDDEISEMLLSIALIPFRKEILKVKTGVEAIEACRRRPDIDLIMMDIQLPVMDGYEATRQIRQFNKDVIIITQTAFALSGDRVKALKAGCNDYISKPINKTLLSEMIKMHFIEQEKEIVSYN